ncbi:radical SAM family heme chaperone HemW [bacterium]|nr:radical SAM family heme chaperone HemW [bacterium]
MSTPPDSLGLYIHVPFCKHACPYCDFYKLELRDRPARARLDFPECVEREHALLLEVHPELLDHPLESIYFGGGTPSVLVPAAVGELVRRLRSRHPDSDPEVTLEANPENLTAGRAQKWFGAGINRLSIGVQSFAEEDLKRLERLHERDTIYEAVRHSRDAGFRNLSLDLMFALPGQSLANWMENLRLAVELEPEHISFYGLTIHERTPFFDDAERGSLILPTDDELAEMYLQGAAYLCAHGFEHYEISNFARPDFRSRHNQRYWSARDVVGMGPGAHSSMGALRWDNPDDLDGWAAAVDEGRLPRSEAEELAPDIQLEEELFRRLRRAEGFALNGARGSADEIFQDWLETSSGRGAAEEGWVARDDERVWLTREGWLVSDALLLRVIEFARSR